jgi:hypothetical protein
VAHGGSADGLLLDGCYENTIDGTVTVTGGGVALHVTTADYANTLRGTYGVVRGETAAAVLLTNYSYANRVHGSIGGPVDVTNHARSNDLDVTGCYRDMIMPRAHPIGPMPSTGR